MSITLIILYLDAGWVRLCWHDVNGAGGSPICSMSSFRLTRWWSGLDGGSEGFGIMLLPVALKVGSVAWSEERLGGSGISLRATDIVSQVEPSVLDQFPPAVFTDILEGHNLGNLSTNWSNDTKILLRGLVIFRHSQLPGSWPWADSVISRGTTSYR